MASLQGLSSAVLDAAKRLLKYKAACHWVTFISAAISIFVTGVLLYILAFAALISELSSWFIAISAANKKSLGQELLRLNILKQAYREDMAIDTAYLKARVRIRELQAGDDFDNPEYYFTRDNSPQVRLVEILQESCFWSQHLYTTCRDRAIKASVGLAVVIGVVVVVGLSIAGPDPNYSAPRLAILFSTLVPLWTEIGKALSFGAGASKLALIDHRLDVSGQNQASLLAIFADYNVVTSNTPLIPQKIYENERDRLNALWAERRGRESL
jgi:hypothetical protein